MESVKDLMFVDVIEDTQAHYANQVSFFQEYNIALLCYYFIITDICELSNFCVCVCIQQTHENPYRHYHQKPSLPLTHK